MNFLDILALTAWNVPPATDLPHPPDLFIVSLMGEVSYAHLALDGGLYHLEYDHVPA